MAATTSSPPGTLKFMSSPQEMDSFFSSVRPIKKKTHASFVQRYHYTNRNLFEQSVDVYRPSLNSDCRDDLIVLLTVGSGWMGHQPFIYRGCSWWNSSGPQTIAASMQCPCVCIRHRGAYFQLPDWYTIVQYCLVPVGVVSTILSWYNTWTSMALVLPLLLAALFALLKWTGQGSASLDDMVDDVATAVAWVHENKNVIFPNNNNNTTGTTTTSQSEPKQTKHGDCQMVFGGYSSGGHVAGTLLQRPADYWKQHGLPPPDKLFQAILYISGVLAVQPPLVRRVGDENETAQTLDSSRTSSSFSSHDDEKHLDESAPTPFVLIKEYLDITKTTTTLPSKTPSPVWLTNFVCRVVWGPKWRQEIPSPLSESYKDTLSLHVRRIPHLLIENRHEMFGLTWLDTFFCAEAYSQRLEQLQVPVIFRQVASDHWNILASRHLHDAVQEVLPKLLDLRQQ